MDSICLRCLPSYLLIFLLFQMVHLHIVNNMFIKAASFNFSSMYAILWKSVIAYSDVIQLCMTSSMHFHITLTSGHLEIKWSVFSSASSQILQMPLEYFIFFRRTSVFNCPWKIFQLKSLHFLGINIFIKLCENHSFQLISTSQNFLLQYSFDLISTCLLDNKASYISLEVKPFNDFTTLLGISNCISSISVLSFDTIPWWVFDMPFQTCGNEAFILLNSKTNPALYTSFWKMVPSSICPPFIKSFILKIPADAQCFMINCFPLNFRWSLNHMISLTVLILAFLQNYWNAIIHSL